MSSNPYPLRKVERSEVNEEPDGRVVVNLYLECGHVTERPQTKKEQESNTIDYPPRVRCKLCEPRANAGSMAGLKRKRQRKSRSWKARFNEIMERITNWRRG